MKCYTEYQVQHRLREFIDCIWTEKETDDCQVGQRSFCIVPDNSIEFVISDHAFTRQHSLTAEVFHMKSHVCGLKTRAQHISLAGNPVLSIRFKPENFWKLVSVNMAETVNGAFDACDLFGKSVSVLRDQIFEETEMSGKIEAIEAYFLKRIEGSRNDDKLFEAAERMLRVRGGNIEIKTLANQLNISPKTIERVFVKRLGVTPKKYSRILRFSMAVKLLNSKEKFTGISYECGFFDQMHFIKDFRKITGMTPSDYLRKDRSLQEGVFSV